MTSDASLLERIHQRSWFYRFDLPDGSHTESYLPENARLIHDTRLRMLKSVLEPEFSGRWEASTAIDLACHQGWFLSYLANKNMQKVLGVDVRQEHIDDASLMTSALFPENKHISFLRSDVYDLKPDVVGQFDVVLLFGLLYHVENPIGLLRIAKSLCKGWCMIETQLGPHLSGPLDWGNYEFVRPMKGAFAVIDEVDETHAPEASSGGYGICLAPSLELLVWLLYRIGFSEVRVVEPEQGDYEQLRHKKRAVVAARV